jgi:glycosyltransferase involved in cell wall biosynthesis
MKSIDIILPVYNEEQGIALFHRSLMDTLDGLAGSYEFRIIYVLDRSSDGTLNALRVLAESTPRMTVVHMSRRFGHQVSLVAGLDQSTGDAAIMMDADLQHPPALIPRLLEEFERGHDIVQTVRLYGTNEGRGKRWASSLFYYLQNALSPVEIRDGMADYRLISRKVVRVFQTSVREQNQFLRGLFRWVGFNRTEVPFVSAARAAGATKYRLGRLLSFSVTGIISFSKLPLRIAALLGFGIALCGGLYAAWLTFEFIRGGAFPPGYTSLIVVVLLMGGLQLMFLGVLGEYVGSIFDEVKGRPLYIVDEIIEGRPS